MFVRHKEFHHAGRVGWLRAAVLGANDGILSTSSLVLGVAAAHATHGSVLVAGIAGLTAGSMSMAAGEYVSVHSQADTEQQRHVHHGRIQHLHEGAEHDGDGVSFNRDLRVLFGRTHSSEEVSNSWTIAQHRSPPLQAVTHVEFPTTWHPKQELSGLRSYAYLLFSR